MVDYSLGWLELVLRRLESLRTEYEDKLITVDLAKEIMEKLLEEAKKEGRKY